MRTLALIASKRSLWGTDHREASTIRIFIPDAEAILLGKTGIPASGEKEKTPGETRISLKQFFTALDKGDSDCVDLLFAGKHAVLERSLEWRDIVDNRDRLLSKSAIPSILTFLDIAHSVNPKLKSKLLALKSLFDSAIALKGNSATAGDIDTELKALNFSDFAILRTDKLTDLLPNIKRVAGLRDQKNFWRTWDYIQGERHRQFASQGHLTFPLVNAELYKAIDSRSATLPAMHTEAIRIEDAIEQIGLNSRMNAWPKTPDRAWMRKTIVRIYGDHVFDTLHG